MWKFDWTDAMSVAVEELDEDHKRTVRLMNLIGAAAASGDFTSVDTLADLMIADLDRHFRREERVLRKYAYPRLTKHAAGHAEAIHLARTFRELAARHNVVDIMQRLDDMRLFFVERLIIEDLDYKWFFLDNRIVPELDDHQVRIVEDEMIRLTDPFSGSCLPWCRRPAGY